jgi:ribose-phosphate pyrophosphokinase
MIKLNNTLVIPTIFPDKTSQVWKLPEELLVTIEKDQECAIYWEFENEAELIHIAQLKTLLDTYCEFVFLHMPYLPYARQDKHISNTSTFAFTTFVKLLNSLNFSRVTTLDAHNPAKIHLIDRIEDNFPRKQILNAFEKTQSDLLLFPDAGAQKRYGAHNMVKSVWANKTRDAQTGHISDVWIEGKVKGRKLLIVDDICDGGMTFKLVAKQALKEGAKEVHLYVTHGIFSKGLQTLHDSGISRIFTHKGEVVMSVITLLTSTGGIK